MLLRLLPHMTLVFGAGFCELLQAAGEDLSVGVDLHLVRVDQLFKVEPGAVEYLACVTLVEGLAVLQ